MLESLFNKLQAFTPPGPQRYYKETPTQVFSCETCETFKNIFFDRKPPVAASADSF